jgi:hypothetical protein
MPIFLRARIDVAQLIAWQMQRCRETCLKWLIVVRNANILTVSTAKLAGDGEAAICLAVTWERQQYKESCREHEKPGRARGVPARRLSERTMSWTANCWPSG